MSLAGTAARLLRRTGQQWTHLRKTQAANAQPWKSGAETLAFDTVQARERYFKPVEIKGGILEGDVLIVVDAATCLRRPQIGDRLAPGIFATEEGGSAVLYAWDYLGDDYTFDDGTLFFDGETEGSGAEGTPEWRQIIAVHEAREAGTTLVYRVQARR